MQVCSFMGKKLQAIDAFYRRKLIFCDFVTQSMFSSFAVSLQADYNAHGS